jgi:hypothetical protein
MIESVKPAGGVEYVSGSKSVRDASVAGQQEEEASYIVDIKSSKDSGENKSNKLSSDQVKAIRQQAEAANASLRNLVEKLLSKQGGTYKSAFGEVDFDSGMTPAQAQEAISEDGEWGVNAVSDRIVAFAIAISGNDTSTLEELKAAIDKGFAQAGQKLGRDLPGICGQTYDAIMTKLDNWASSGGVDTEA